MAWEYKLKWIAKFMFLDKTLPFYLTGGVNSKKVPEIYVYCILHISVHGGDFLLCELSRIWA